MLHKECIMKTAEPWNNARVTFNISKEAANRLKHLAIQNDEQLKRLGVLSVQLQGEDTVRLSIGSRGSVQEVLVRQQPPQLTASGALVTTSGGFGHGNDPHEFDTILNQIKAGQLHPNLSGYVATEDQNVFVVPQSTKRPNSRKVKEKGSAKFNSNNELPSATTTLNVSTPNGPAISSSNTSNSQELLSVRRDTSNHPNMTDSFGDLGDMHHLDFNDLIGADGSLDNLEIGGKHYNEMVTDILHMDGMTGPQQNPTLGISPTSVTSNQVRSQISGGNMNNANLIASNPSEHNTNEVDELLDHIQSIGSEAEQSNSRLNPNLDISYNQANSFPNASGTSPAIQRQMSYPQYSSKGLVHGPNTQGMYASGVSGRHSVGQINTAVASPVHHNMMGNLSAGSDSTMHLTGKQFPGGLMDKSMEAGFPDFNQPYTHCNQDMIPMHKQMISRPPSAGIMQTSAALNSSWKMPAGQHQHTQVNTMQRSPGLASPKPMNMPGPAGYNPTLTPTKRSYPGLSTVSHMDVQNAGDGSKVQCMSMASPLLVNLLQTSASTTIAGSGHIVNAQLAGTVGEPPRPKKKKPARKKKISKQGGYNSSTPDPSMIPSPSIMPGQMAAHMSPQHGGARMQQTHFNSQFGMQPVNSPGQYYHPPQSPMPQIRGGMPEGQKGAAMFGHYPNGTNISSPGLHPMGKASGHLFSSDRKTAYIETTNRSDVGSIIANNTSMVQQRVPTPGHSPSAHGQITPNHLPSNQVGAGAGMFMGNISGTVHHGPRIQGMNGMQHPQMQNRVQVSPGLLHGMPTLHQQNLRVGGPSPGTPNNSTMSQQFALQQHHKPGFQFQSPPPTPHSNPSAMYNQQIASTKPKQPNMMASPSHVAADFMQEPPPNVVFNGSDSMRQAVAQQRQPLPGYQKRGVIPSEQMMMMQNDGASQNLGNFYHQQGNSNPGHMGMKTLNNALYHNSSAQIHVAGPNNFNNSNNMDGHKVLGQDPMMSSALAYCSATGTSNVTDATVTHFPMSARQKIGVLDSGEVSVLLKGTCHSMTHTTRITHPLVPEIMGQKMTRISKKSPGSATDGLSSSPGSSHSHTPSPAGMKRCLSTSNPPTPLHLESMGSPTPMTLHHSGAKPSAPRHKSSCSISTGHRPPMERQSSISRSQISPATPSPITVNGPHLLSRPASRTEIGQQYMTPPGTPGSSRPHFQNVPSYSQVPESPLPFTTSRDNMPSSAIYTHIGGGDMVVLPSQSNYQTQSNENNWSKFGTPDLVQSQWTNTVSNHHPSSRQMNSSSGLGDPVVSQNSAAVTSINSFSLHESSNTNQNSSKDETQSNYLNNALPYGISPQSTEPTSSPCTPVSDMVQGPLRTNNSPTFFNNQADNLLSSSKKKKQPENSPAPTVPLQS